LVKLETNAFLAIEKKDPKTAYSLVVSDDYDKHKDELYKTYRLWADSELDLTTSIQDNIFTISQQLVYINLGFSLVVSLLLTLVMVLLRSIISQPKTDKILEGK
jgi:hypothetical protein